MTYRPTFRIGEFSLKPPPQCAFTARKGYDFYCNYNSYLSVGSLLL